MNIGPRTRKQLTRLSQTWKQGEHVVVSGATGSGKTTLARRVLDIRLQQGGFVVVFIAKLNKDKTVAEDYKGFTRWKEWKRNPGPHDNRILLWPDVSKAETPREQREIQRKVFAAAIAAIMRSGKWTVVYDEGLYMCSPQFMNLADEIAMMFALGRSDNITILMNMQRPSNVPLIAYGSASHAFIGRTRELADLKRVSELGGRHSAKELSGKLSELGRHDFLWIPVAPDWPPEVVNLQR